MFTFYRTRHRVSYSYINNKQTETVPVTKHPDTTDQDLVMQIMQNMLQIKNNKNEKLLIVESRSTEAIPKRT